MRVRLQSPLVLLPERASVVKLCVPTQCGLLTLLPRHCDGLVVVAPGLFSLFTPEEEVLASGGGLLIKQGELVTVTAEELLSGPLEDLTRLADELRSRQQRLEGAQRAQFGKMETDFVRRFRELGRT